MNTLRTLTRGTDAALVARIASGEASTDERQAFALQLRVGLSEPLIGAQIETQSDFAGSTPAEPNGQALFF